MRRLTQLTSTKNFFMYKITLMLMYLLRFIQLQTLDFDYTKNFLKLFEFEIVVYWDYDSIVYIL